MEHHRGYNLYVVGVVMRSVKRIVGCIWIKAEELVQERTGLNNRKIADTLAVNHWNPIWLIVWRVIHLGSEDEISKG